MHRRTFGAWLAVAGTLGVSGCVFGREEYRSVTVANRDDLEHETAIEIASSSGEGPGDTEYFEQSMTIDAGGQRAFEEAISVSDGPPQDVWIRVRIDGTRVLDEAYRFPEETIRVRIAGAEDVTIDVDP